MDVTCYIILTKMWPIWTQKMCNIWCYTFLRHKVSKMEIFTPCEMFWFLFRFETGPTDTMSSTGRDILPWYCWEGIIESILPLGILGKTEGSITNGNIWLMTGVTDKVQLMSSEIHAVISICAYDICGNSHLYIQFTQFNGGASVKSRRWDEWREKQRTRCGGREALERLTDYKSRLIRLQS